MRNLKIIEKQGDIVLLAFVVPVGSINETESQSGIAHFIEHLLFSKTKTKNNSEEITKAIEFVGGEINAFTSYSQTVYYVKIYKKHFDIAFETLQDIFLNTVLTEKNIEKERKVILNELQATNDSPSSICWDNLFKSMFGKNPIIGKESVIESLQKEDLEKFYKKYYTKESLKIIGVGDFTDVQKEVLENFLSQKQNHVKTGCLATLVVAEKIIEKEIDQTYVALVWDVLPYPDFVLDVNKYYTFKIYNAILSFGMSGKLFQKIREELGLCYSIGSGLFLQPSFGQFYISYSTKENYLEVNKTVLDFLKNLEITNQDVENAKESLIGSDVLRHENYQNIMERNLNSILIDNYCLAEDFKKGVKDAAFDKDFIEELIASSTPFVSVVKPK